MTDISVNGLVKSYELGKNILDGLSFDIAEGEHVGILGPNGCGKTTLFRILVGTLDYDEGAVAIAGGKRLGLISQIPVYPEGWTTEDVLKDAHRRLYDVQRRLDEISQKMASDTSPVLLAEYDRLSESFRLMGGYDMDVERNRVANGLDITGGMRFQPFDSLSGGEKTRVNLARLILEDTDILLLDEPTNHLDLHATEWLEGIFCTSVAQFSPLATTGIFWMWHAAAALKSAPAKQNFTAATTAFMLRSVSAALMKNSRNTRKIRPKSNNLPGQPSKCTYGPLWARISFTNGLSPWKSVLKSSRLRKSPWRHGK